MDFILFWLQIFVVHLRKSISISSLCGSSILGSSSVPSVSSASLFQWIPDDLLVFNAKGHCTVQTNIFEEVSILTSTTLWAISCTTVFQLYFNSISLFKWIELWLYLINNAIFIIKCLKSFSYSEFISTLSNNIWILKITSYFVISHRFQS